MAQVQLAHSSFSFLSQGAIIREFCIDGQNLVLSFDTEEPYLTAPYFSQTIGRVANRIRKGLIEDLNGRSYQLEVNDNGINHLHGGNVGWGHRKLSGPHQVTRNGRGAIHFTYRSPDGEEGYPGTVELRVWYFTYEDDNVSCLEIEYEVEMTGTECKQTIVNVTSHPYFNISHTPTINGTEVKLATNKYLKVDENGIPTGDMAELSIVQKDHWFTLGERDPSFDHCFVMDPETTNLPIDTRQRDLRKLVSTRHPATGLHLEVYSTEPAFQFYTGDFVDVPATSGSPARGARAGFCVEPGRFINAINESKWRSQVVLDQGQSWGSKIVYKAWKA